MNSFTIYFNETTVLEINGKKTTFVKGKKYGFQFMSDKETKAIRKAAIKNRDILFTETNNFAGSFKVIYGNKEAKDIKIDNLVLMNKGKKNKNPKAFKPTEKPVDKHEPIENIVPPVEESIIIDSEGDVNNE